jgi:tetraacyldisaccharide 4'-kinase
VVINRHRTLDFAYDDKTFYLKTKISYSDKLTTKSLFAFCGLGVPSKFYNSLNKEGLCLQETKSFADHHSYTDQDISKLVMQAKQQKLQLVTTFKDIVKIDSKYHDDIQTVELKLELTKAIKSFLEQKIADFANKK